MYHNLLLYNQYKQTNSKMNQEFLTILAFFTHLNDTTKKFVIQLLRQAYKQLDESSFKDMNQWQILSQRLDSPTKINCLSDENHRSLIIEFMRQGATQYYKCSYFNNAKIDAGYLPYLKTIGPIQFIETIKIVNKLKLVEKHFRLKMELNIITENHIDQYIRKIMEKCNSSKRKVNNNFEKFKAIVDFQDRLELIKQLGKLLRKSWSSQKQKSKEVVPSQSVKQSNEQINATLLTLQTVIQSHICVQHNQQQNEDNFFSF